MNRSLSCLTVLCALIPTTQSPAAQLEILGPFVGEYSETFEGIQSGVHFDLPILNPNPSDSAGGPLGTMASAGVVFGSTFMGSTVNAHSGGLFAHTTSPGQFSFNTPIRAFGGYFATNGGASGGTVEFFDAQNELLATAALDVTFQSGLAPYTWNGWLLDTPFSHVKISGNGTLNGFLGYDDLQASSIPGPGSMALAVACTLLSTRSRRRATCIGTMDQ